MDAGERCTVLEQVLIDSLKFLRKPDAGKACATGKIGTADFRSFRKEMNVVEVAAMRESRLPDSGKGCREGEFLQGGAIGKSIFVDG